VNDEQLRQRANLIEKYDRWCEHRERLSAAEESGNYPAPGAWQDSDDTGTALLDEAMDFVVGLTA
jgi:hypothetical protein